MLEAVSLGKDAASGSGQSPYDHVIVTRIGDDLGLNLSASLLKPKRLPYHLHSPPYPSKRSGEMDSCACNYFLFERAA